MARTVERTFLVKKDPAWHREEGPVCRKGYLALGKKATVAVYITEGKSALTVKGIREGMSQIVFEYAIPVEDAATMLDALCEKPLIKKRLYAVEHAGVTWQIEEFLAENTGLQLASVTSADDDQDFEKPAWIGKEVTGDPQYLDTYLVASPYTTWQSR